MLAHRTAKEGARAGKSATSRIDSVGLHEAQLLEQRDRDATISEYLAERAEYAGVSQSGSGSSKPFSNRPSSFKADWKLSQISIYPDKPKPPRVSRALGRKTSAAVSEPDDASELEAKAFADWITSVGEPELARGGRRNFSEGTQGYLGAHLGHDFSSVRVHTDGYAARTAHDFGARAYTVGNDVYFGRDHFDPDSREGRRLLAHELTHVAQQREGRISGTTVHRDEDLGMDRPKRIKAYKEASKKPDWQRAALMLNDLNRDDIDRQIADLGEPEVRAIIAAADVVMKDWPRHVQERCEIRLKKWELTDFDRDWIKRIAMPILVYPDASISLDHRILMVAHARLESGAIPGGGKFKEPDGWNVFNIQVDAGMPNTKKVPRWEYNKKVPEEEAEKVDLNLTMSIESNGRKEKWKKYKKLPSGEVREFVKVCVGIPQYADMNEAIKGYLEFLKKVHKTALTALTTDDQGAAAFAGGITHFGTGYDQTIGKKIEGFVGEMRPKLRDYARERLSQLTKDANAERLPGEEAVLKQLDK
jgi:hypothetical protein